MKVALYQNSNNLLLVLVIAVLFLVFFGTILHQIYESIEKRWLEKWIEKVTPWENLLRNGVYKYCD